MVIRKNPICEHLRESVFPKISSKAFVDPQAFVCGNVTIEENVYVAPFASIRADEGSPFFIGANSNVQDGVILHGLETYNEEGQCIKQNMIEINDKFYSIYIGGNVSLAHQVHIHGPSAIESNTFIGMQSFIFKSRIGSNCVIEPGAKVIGVTIPKNKIIPAGTILRLQGQVASLEDVTEEYQFAHINKAVVHVNTDLAKAYNSSV